jgi:hypothetical protein
MGFLRMLLLLPLIAAAQTSPPPAALLRGVLLERDAQTPSGEFSIRGADNHVIRYLFDRKTYVEREKQLIDVARLNPGDQVEVVSDVAPGSALRYARTIHVIEEAPRPAQSLGRVRMPRPGATPASTGAADRLVASATLSYSGVILRSSSDRLVLRQRSGSDETIFLREDTSYLQDGLVVGRAELKPNMRVFIRGGKDVYQQTQAYQVIWGNILAPK